MYQCMSTRDNVSDELDPVGGNHSYWETESDNSQIHISSDYSLLFKCDSKPHNPG